MRDIVVLADHRAFFALCVAYVRWCDHIIGPDPRRRTTSRRHADDATTSGVRHDRRRR